ncbi:MAG: hypothetical protein M3460_11930 [Actinomycetota bacterium]|nr:hypothetical protein [Actinomycetota bacterium]
MNEASSTPEQEHILADAQAVALILDPTTYGESVEEMLQVLTREPCYPLAPRQPGKICLIWLNTIRTRRRRSAPDMMTSHGSSTPGEAPSPARSRQACHL